MNELSQKIEALLFTAGEAASFEDLAQLTTSSLEEVASALEEIREHLSSHGITLLTTHTHAELVTNPNVAPFLSQFIEPTTQELSKAAIETLSIIAYKGPISRLTIDAIRGIDSRRMLAQLTLRGLVAQHRAAGKETTYSVTEEFLSHIGATRVEDLPQYQTLSQAQI